MNIFDTKSAKWLLDNTKKCPQCNIAIEHNKGCLHMTCKQCFHQFCWACLDDWDTVTGHTYFKCPGTEKFNNVLEVE